MGCSCNSNAKSSITKYALERHEVDTGFAVKSPLKYIDQVNEHHYQRKLSISKLDSLKKTNTMDNEASFMYSED